MQLLGTMLGILVTVAGGHASIRGAALKGWPKRHSSPVYLAARYPSAPNRRHKRLSTATAAHVQEAFGSLGLFSDEVARQLPHGAPKKPLSCT